MLSLLKNEGSVNLEKNPQQIADLAEKRKERFTLPGRIPEKQRRPTLLSYAAALRARGKNEQEILELLLEANQKYCDPPLDNRALRDLRRIAAWCGRKPAGVAKTSVASKDVTQAINNTQAFADSFHWRGSFSLKCRIALYAVLALMLKTNKDHVAFSIRDLAEITGFASGTVATILRALSGRAIRPHVPVVLICHQPDRQSTPRYANSFSLRPVNSPKLEHTLEEGTRERVSAQIWGKPLHDAFRGQKGMSANYALALDAVEAGGIHSARELSERVGLSEKTAQRALTTLKREGLVEKKDGVWCRTEVSLDVVAENRGSAGHFERQQRQHQHERDNYLMWFADGRPKKREFRPLVTVSVPVDVRRETPGPVWWEEELRVS